MLIDTISKRVKRKEELLRLTRLLASQETALKTAFGKAVREIKGAVKIKQIADLLAGGDFDAALGTLDDIAPGAFTKHFVTERTRLFQQAGAAQAKVLANKTPLVNVRFDVTNQFAVDNMRQNELRLVTNFTDTQRATTKQALLRGVTGGDNPRKMARSFRDSIGLTPTQERAVANYRRALETGDPIALERKLRDRRFDGSVRRAFSEGKDIDKDKVDKLTDRYRERYIKYRSEVIGRTEALRTVHEGTGELWEQAVEAGQVESQKVRRYWQTANDGRVRNSHSLIPSLNSNGRGLTEPFQTPLGPLMRPGDPAGLPSNILQCRCVLLTELLTDKEVEALESTGDTDTSTEAVVPDANGFKRGEARAIVLGRIRANSEAVRLADGRLVRRLEADDNRKKGYYIGEADTLTRITQTDLINTIRQNGLADGVSREVPVLAKPKPTPTPTPTPDKPKGPRTQQQIIEDLKNTGGDVKPLPGEASKGEIVDFIKQATGNIDDTLASALAGRFEQDPLTLLPTSKFRVAHYRVAQNKIDMDGSAISSDMDFNNRYIASFTHELGHYIDRISSGSVWKGRKATFRSSYAIFDILEDVKDLKVRKKEVAFYFSQKDRQIQNIFGGISNAPSETNRIEYLVSSKRLDKFNEVMREKGKTGVAKATQAQLEEADRLFDIDGDFKFAEHKKVELSVDGVYRLGRLLEEKDAQTYMEIGLLQDQAIKKLSLNNSLVLDYYASLTGNKVGMGHTNGYYKRGLKIRTYSNKYIRTGLRDANTTEAFANYLEISRRDPFAYAILKVLTPRTAKRFEELLENVGKNEEKYIAGLDDAPTPVLTPKPKPARERELLAPVEVPVRTQAQIVEDLKRVESRTKPPALHPLETSQSELVDYIKVAFGTIDDAMAVSIAKRFQQRLVNLRKGSKAGAKFFYSNQMIDMGVTGILKTHKIDSENMATFAHELGHYLDSIDTSGGSWQGARLNFRSGYAVRQVQEDIKELSLSYKESLKHNEFVGSVANTERGKAFDALLVNHGRDKIANKKQLEEADNFFNISAGFKFADFVDYDFPVEDLYELGIILERRYLRGYVDHEFSKNYSERLIYGKNKSAAQIKDYYGALTGNTVGRGHSSSYYKQSAKVYPYDGKEIRTSLRENNLTEAFAQFVSVSQRDPLGFAVMKVFTPRTIKRFELLRDNIGVDEEKFIAGLDKNDLSLPDGFSKSFPRPKKSNFYRQTLMR